jgi:DNA helicase-2/ATP-dependent DNA helicase PcrA
MQFLNQLNDRQKQAVTTIEGPVMVVAGPGTGKTQILASRIAYILDQTDSKSQNILCLTYTDAGTIAMRNRLIDFIGMEAHRIAIHTFHSFCNRVIQENQDQFNYKNLDPITDLERIELLTSIAQDLDENHPLKKLKGNVTYLVGALGQLFDWMKKEHVTPSIIKQKAELRRQEMIDGDEFRYKRKYKEFQAGDLNPKKLAEAERKLNELVAASELFDVYQHQMQEQQRYDYSDMILWVIDLFRTNPDVLANYQEQFHYFLVDEYQDTSGSQNEVLQLLLNYWEKPNIFVVGDDDQSIYRFQGAEVKNVIDFVNTYSDHLSSVLLQTNYRSTQSILDVAKVIIDRNEERLVNLSSNLSKNLWAHNDPNGDGQPVQLVELDNEYLQAWWITHHIKHQIDRGENASDFAVIYSNHAHGQQVAELLKSEGIPVYLKRSDDILESRSVRSIITLLRYIYKELRFPFSADFELFEILHFDGFGLRPLVLARLSYYFNLERRTYKSWRNFLALLPELPVENLGITRTEKEQVVRIGDQLEDLVHDAANLSLYQTISNAVKALNVSQTALSSKEFNFELESIASFLHFVEQEANLNKQMALGDLLQKLELMEHHRLAIRKEHLVYDKSGVNLLTAHASKGLEFKHVFVIHCIESAWEKRRKRPMPFSLHQIFAKDAEHLVQEEVRRLFYVAMTRAETSLTLTYFKHDAKGKEVSRSAYIDELDNLEQTQLHKPVLDLDFAGQSLHKMINQDAQSGFELLDPPFLDDYLNNYTLSVSHLNTYLECQTRFYFQYVLRVPATKNIYMSFGIAIHNALDQIIKTLNSEPADFTAAKLTELYEFYLKREQAVFSDKQFEDFRILGRAILPEYFDHFAERWRSVERIETEVLIDRVELNGVPIKGQLDQMEYEGNMVKVIDFKTGDAENGLKKMKPPKENAVEGDSLDKRFGGSYWRQIQFYALLVHHDRTRTQQMITGEMSFVEPVSDGEYLTPKIVITPEDQQTMTGIIENVYQNIRNKQFADGCKKPDCYWCSFLDRYYSGNN